MNKVFHHLPALSLGLLLGLVSCASRRPAQPVISLHSAKPGTEVQLEHGKGRCIAEIRCPDGIGWAKFILSPAARPGNVMFRLRLRGLECASFEHDGVETQFSVSSHGDLSVREWRKEGTPIASRDRILVVPVSASGGQPRIPLDGWFEIRLSASCVGNCTVRLTWIDFYR